MGTKEGIQWQIKPLRVAQAERILTANIPLFTHDELWDMAYQIGIEECISYPPDMQGFNYDFSDIQIVAFAAVLQCLGEWREAYEER